LSHSDPEVAQAVFTGVNTACDWLREELGVRDGTPVADLLNLIVIAAVHAAEHPEGTTLAEAVKAGYGGGDGQYCGGGGPDACPCDDVVGDVLAWLDDLR
jgi:hypothetical protein